MTDYQTFLDQKRIIDSPTGFSTVPKLNKKLFPFQRDIVSWALRRGRAALFEDCGLGKTFQQLEWAHHVNRATEKPVLILTPLAVADQTQREGNRFGIASTIIESASEVTAGINISNYEKLHRLDCSVFGGVVLDESSILKSYDGATRTAIIEAFRRTPYRLAATATPAPNDYMELGNHAEFLGVMSRSEMLATFFVHDGGDTSKWRLKGHAESDFWRWLCSWAVNLRKPSNLGYSDDGFDLPPLRMVEHLVATNFKEAGMLFGMPVSSLEERRTVRRASIDERNARAVELANSNSEQWIVWCNLNDESAALSKGISGAVEVTGSDSDEHKIKAMREFADGKARVLVSKSSICGFGMNWQHCGNVIYFVDDSHERLYQAVRRCWRFGRTEPVTVHLIASELESTVISNLKRKESDAQRMADEMIRHMADISSATIKGSIRETISYNPTTLISIPQWLTAA